MQSQELNQTIEQLLSPITVSFQFVPYSRIAGTDREWKHDGKPTEALHYNVIFKNGDRELWRTNYAMGVGHIPGYKHYSRTIADQERYDFILEQGYTNKYNSITFNHRNKILPKLADVIYNLVSDSDVLNYAGFEEWANEFGYDPDPRSAEKTYKQCLESALTLRNLLGEDKLTELRDLLADY